jgi:hypothetical protein
MEHISKALSKAEREKSLATTSPHSEQRWAEILWALAQSRYKELTAPEITVWKAKLSAYPSDVVEWALIAYNGEFFPNPGTICQMIELKLESIHGEQQSREWNAWKANQSQAVTEGRLATDEDYERLRAECREILAKAPVITAEGKNGKKAQGQAGKINSVPELQKAVEYQAADQLATGSGEPVRNAPGVRAESD